MASLASTDQGLTVLQCSNLALARGAVTYGGAARSAQSAAPPPAREQRSAISIYDHAPAPTGSLAPAWIFSRTGMRYLLNVSGFSHIGK
jgi:hypothetical protein